MKELVIYIVFLTKMVIFSHFWQILEQAPFEAAGAEVKIYLI